MLTTNGVSQDFISKPETLRNIVNHPFSWCKTMALSHFHHYQVGYLLQISKFLVPNQMCWIRIPEKDQGISFFPLTQIVLYSHEQNYNLVLCCWFLFYQRSVWDRSSCLPGISLGSPPASAAHCSLLRALSPGSSLPEQWLSLTSCHPWPSLPPSADSSCNLPRS